MKREPTDTRPVGKPDWRPSERTKYIGRTWIARIKHECFGHNPPPPETINSPLLNNPDPYNLEEL